MSVARFLPILVLCGCGPTVSGESAGGDGGGDVSDRIIGSWSARGDGAYATDNTVLEINADGSLTMTHVSRCGEMPSGTEEFLWSAIDPTTIEVTDLDGSPMGGYRGDSTRFVFSQDACNGPPFFEWLSEQNIDGEMIKTTEQAYVRGEFCFTQLGPLPEDVVEGPSCQLRWCNDPPEEPPSCAE